MTFRFIGRLLTLIVVHAAWSANIPNEGEVPKEPHKAPDPETYWHNLPRPTAAQLEELDAGITSQVVFRPEGILVSDLSWGHLVYKFNPNEIDFLFRLVKTSIANITATVRRMEIGRAHV